MTRLAILAAALTCWVAVGTAAADPPAISGTPQEGHTLNVSTGTNWTGDPTLTYQWQDCDASGQYCSPVAANGMSSSYTLQNSDVGSTIEAIVYAAGQGSATTASVGPVVPSPWVASAEPVITGTAEQGQTMNVSNGAWSVDPTGYTYAWKDCDGSGNCSPIAGAASPGYALQASDVGHTIVATVTATDAYGDVSEPSPSASVGPVVSDATTTTLLASPNSAVANQTITLIATVSSAAGAPAPSGNMTFENGGTAIGGCANVPVAPTGQSVTVVCSASFAPSTAELTAVFVPGAGSSLQGSTSPTVGVAIIPSPTSSPPAAPVSVVQAPVSAVPVSGGVLGTITSTMQWTFYYTPSYTQIRAFVVNGVPPGATVLVKCHGGGCPFLHHAVVLATMKRCGANATGMCSTRGGFDLAPGFVNQRLAVGTRITLVISRPSWIGKYYAFTVRPHKGPRIRITCLAPGAAAPGTGC